MADGDGVAPPGWPSEVRPPGVPDWDRTAMAWLFDQCPPDYRAYDVLRQHPVVLAHLAAQTVAGGIDGAERALRTARHELRDVVAPEAVDAALAAYERERHRLRRTAVAVDLVGRALRGERWRTRL